MVTEGFDEPVVARKTMECLECGTVLGGEGNRDPYGHMLHCLNVQPNAVARIREQAYANGTENGKRVVAICDFIKEQE